MKLTKIDLVRLDVLLQLWCHFSCSQDQAKPCFAQTTGILNSERFCFLLVETTINAKFEPGITSNYILKLKIAEKNAKSITQNVAFEQRVYRTQIRYSVGRALILSRDTNKCWTIAYFVTWYS